MTRDQQPFQLQGKNGKFKLLFFSFFSNYCSSKEIKIEFFSLSMLYIFVFLITLSLSDICCENANSPLSPSYESCSLSSNWTSPAPSCVNCYVSQIQCSTGIGSGGSGCTNSTSSVAPICVPSKICSVTATTNCTNCNSASPVCSSPASICFGLCSSYGK